MKWIVTPQKALCDEKVQMRIEGAAPQSQVEVTADLAYPWAPDVKFQSRAWFTADKNGTVNLETMKPDKGSYDYPGSMGLIESLELFSGRLNDVTAISVNESMVIHLTASQGGEEVRCVLERIFLAPEVKRRKLEGEVVGELFFTEEKGRSTIVVLGGSDGNLRAIRPVAALFASRGFNALALAYFNNTGLPKQLEEVPLDYAAKAFSWLQNCQETKDNPIFLHGTSKGGEMALLLASIHPQIEKTAVMAPHAYCFQGLGYRNRSSWTLGGKPLPFIRMKNSEVFKDMAKSVIKNKPFGYTRIYRDGVNQAQNREAARIKVENGSCEYLLVSGTEDNIWNACDGCRVVESKLKEVNYPRDYQHVSYEGAGHPFYPPYILPVTTNKVKMAPRFTFFSGGSLEKNAKAQAEAWQKTLEFFKS